MSEAAQEPSVTPQRAPGATEGAVAHSAEPQKTRQEVAKSSNSLREAVTKAMRRWGGGVPEHLREQITGAARFDKFTERAKKVLVLAQGEAQAFNHNYIGTEHLLLGLIHEGNGIAAKVLENMEISLPEVRRGVEFVIGRGDKPVNGPISLTPRSKRAIELALDEARRLNHNYIGTEHLLLGLVREGEGVGAGVLEQMGADLDRVRAKVLEVVAASPTRDTVISCRVDAADLAALDMLVEAGIRTTRSDAAQWLIHAGIVANKTLFDEVKGTVDEIRRLRDQARQTAWKVAGENAGEGEGGEAE